MPLNLIPQGTLNRLRASFIFPLFPNLSITAPFLGKRGITLAFQGDLTVYIDTMTGAVTSPEPYVRFVATVHLLKSQAFSNQFKAQIEALTLLGPGVIRPDVSTQQPYNMSNCAITTPGPQDFSGADADFPVGIGGVWNVNAGLFLT